LSTWVGLFPSRSGPFPSSRRCTLTFFSHRGIPSARSRTFGNVSPSRPGGFFSDQQLSSRDRRRLPRNMTSFFPRSRSAPFPFGSSFRSMFPSLRLRLERSPPAKVLIFGPLFADSFPRSSAAPQFWQPPFFGFGNDGAVSSSFHSMGNAFFYDSRSQDKPCVDKLVCSLRRDFSPFRLQNHGLLPLKPEKGRKIFPSISFFRKGMPLLKFKEDNFSGDLKVPGGGPFLREALSPFSSESCREL